MDLNLVASLIDGSVADAAQALLPHVGGGGYTDSGIVLAQATPDPDTNKKIVESTLDGTQGAMDFSIWAMIVRADVIVKAVIAILVLASVWSWAIIFEKWLTLRRINRRTDRFEDEFWAGGSVDELYDRVGQKPRSPMASIFSAAMQEWRRSNTAERAGQRSLSLGVKDRIERVMQIALGREMDKMERYTGFLATVGATAPFIGLFGTVWGIMNSFKDIAVQKNTNLATVAPGISEALFATALGLVAAIPAVIAYNKLSSDFDRYAHRLEGFVGEFGAIVSRELERGDN